MQSKEAVVEDGEIKSVTVVGSEIDGWTNFGDDDIMQQQHTIQSEEVKKVPFVDDPDKAQCITLRNFSHFLSGDLGLITLLGIVLITCLS